MNEEEYHEWDRKRTIIHDELYAEQQREIENFQAYMVNIRKQLEERKKKE